MKLHLLNPKVAVSLGADEHERTLGVTDHSLRSAERLRRERANDDRVGVTARR
ncbi:hypothetical protein L6R49_02990 [Myxococcota bacterium]|nr:hypothetical protein [Myxococcota bacterium]